MVNIVAVVTQVLFGVLFLWAAWMAIRRHDALARDVALVFAPIVVLYGSGVADDVFGKLPFWVSAATSVLLLAQPVFSLKLVSEIRGLPRGLLPLATGAFVISSIWLVVTLGKDPFAYLSAVAIFIVTELTAACYFTIEARRRSGAARVRLAVAAVATAGVALAIFAIGLSAVAPGETVLPAGVILQIAALLAAVGYWIAFLPPGQLRRFWQGSAAFAHSEQLLAAPPTTSSTELWTQLAQTAHQLTGAAIVILVVDGDSIRIAASSDPAFQPPMTYPGVPLAAVLSSATDPVTDDLIARTRSRFSRIVPLRPDEAEFGAIVLLRPRASLFDGDDSELVRALGVRSAHLVLRRQVLAEQESMSIRLAESLAALEAASAAKSDFLASLSHELRTPLNAIMGFSSLMAAEEEVDGTLPVPREWVEHIRSGGDHLLSLINDVLDLSKVEAGRLDLALAAVELGPAIGDSVAHLRPLADQKGQLLDVSVEPALVVEADPGRLRQVLYNLLSNAIKYTPEGGSIWVAAERNGTEIRLSVRDTGIGIAPEDHERAFEEFSQVGETPQHIGGTGLGLSLSRRLVEAHGGRLDLVSQLGAGSTFTVILPDRARAASPVADQPAPDGLGPRPTRVLPVPIPE